MAPGGPLRPENDISLKMIAESSAVDYLLFFHYDVQKGSETFLFGARRMNNIYKEKTDVLRIIRENQSKMAARFTVQRIGVFGSFARGQAGPESDVDILVELNEPTFDNYMDLKF